MEKGLHPVQLALQKGRPLLPGSKCYLLPTLPPGAGGQGPGLREAITLLGLFPHIGHTAQTTPLLRHSFPVPEGMVSENTSLGGR